MDALPLMTSSKPPDLSLSPQRRRVRMLLVVALVSYSLVAFLGTHLPIPPGLIPHGGDTVLHFLGYSVFGVLLMGLRASLGPFRWPSVLGRVVFLACYGAFDEFTQAFVGRTADVVDWCADVPGACCGIFAVVLLVRVCSRRKTAAEATDSTRQSD